MRRRISGRRATAAAAAIALVAVLALPGTAGAGGFATVGLSSLPDGTAPGAPWRVTLTILQHGNSETPLRDLRPVVRIRSADGRTTRTFTAVQTGKAGEYRANVVFPSAGRWTYTIADGFSLTHRFAPVAIGSSRAIATPGREAPSGSVPSMQTSSPTPATAQRPRSGSGSGSGPNVWAALAAALAAGLLAALATAALLRRRAPGAGGAAPAPR